MLQYLNRQNVEKVMTMAIADVDRYLSYGK